MKRNLRIADDNERVFESLEINFQQLGYTCLWAPDRKTALRLGRENKLVAAIVDLSLGEEDGIEVMRELFELQADLPAIVITGFGTFPAAVRAIKLGAYDFLAKPLNFELLNDVLQEALRMGSKPDGGVGRIRAGAANLVTASAEMLALWEKAAQLANTDIPVLITGESGTGKELVAQRIHERSARSGGPFVRVNCSAVADTLADSEFFGHGKGAFTGASDDRPGLFRQADGGTLHLDEIGDMSAAIQAKLLRVLEDSRIRPVGWEKDVVVDVRVVASTNKNLALMVDEGMFREDLFYRLNAVQLHIPPLRERVDDIEPLLEHFLRQFGDGRMEKRFSDKALRRLRDYYWPGNVRELRNTVKVCAAITPGNIIEVEDLPASIRAAKPATSISGRIIDAEKDLIIQALEENNGNRQITSQRLGISRRTLYNKMKRYGLE
ncbi:MAG: sigma-54 dependent transcriptional regulator [Planctomycetes bacterium]|nr:sigma-54 dependent transcriptional regulator [Planctomycetota bacterium]